MTLRHHPDDALLLDHAAGTLDMPMNLILASHLCFCEQCRARVALDEQIGGLLIEEIAPVPLAEDSLAKTMRRLGAPAADAGAVRSDDRTPPPLRAFLGRDLSDVRWHQMGSRLSYATLYRRGPLTMRLLRGVPGSKVGHHTHRGIEYTLVLRGGFTDETGQYGPGDFQVASSDVTHNPIADPGEDCINLAVTTRPLRFRSAMRRLVAALYRF